jgi:hypothetical protein
VPIRNTAQPATDTPAAEPQAPGAALSEEQRAEVRASLHFGADILALPPTRWLVRGVLPQQGIGAIYGKAGGGKSFIAVHLAFEAATGGEFFGEPFPRPLRVVYVAAERASETRDRFEAQAVHRGLATMPDNLALLNLPKTPQVLGDFERLRYAFEAVAAERWGGAKPDLVIFDTYAKMTIGTEENAAKEVGPIVELFTTLIKGCGGEAFGLLIHHEGKQKEAGLRGSTALLGALDVVMYLSGVPENLTLAVTKLNAAKPPQDTYFEVKEQPIPDPDDPGTDGVRVLRNAGVATPMPYREHAEGLEAEVLQVLREELRGVDTAAAIMAACPSKPSKRSVNRALENLEKQRQPLVKLVGKGRASKWQLVEAEQLEAFEE